MVHADCHPGNLAQQEQGLGLLDWDRCGWGPFLSDLASCTLALDSAEREPSWPGTRETVLCRRGMQGRCGRCESWPPWRTWGSWPHDHTSFLSLWKRCLFLKKWRRHGSWSTELGTPDPEALNVNVEVHLGWLQAGSAEPLPVSGRDAGVQQELRASVRTAAHSTPTQDCAVGAADSVIANPQQMRVALGDTTIGHHSGHPSPA